MGSFTTHLTQAHPAPLLTATTAPFLRLAGLGILPPSALSAWLVQDKYYQFAYVNFIGRLISRLDLTSFLTPPAKAERNDNLPWRTLGTLMAALEAIKREIEFYDETVEGYGLGLEWRGMEEVTRGYVRLFEESSGMGEAGGGGVGRGLVVLWATEFCYLKAWSYAKSHAADSGATKGSEGAIAALHKEFIPNWTSEGFEAAVTELAEVTNHWAAQMDEAERAECEKLYLRVLDLEAEFWPTV